MTNVNFFVQGQQIGSALLDKLDPPMGCALGAFIPTEAYDRTRDALHIGGAYNEAALSCPIVVKHTDGRIIPCKGASIEDCHPLLHEIEVDVFCIDHDIYVEMFRSHPHYVDYYSSQGCAE